MTIRCRRLWRVEWNSSALSRKKLTRQLPIGLSFFLSVSLSSLFCFSDSFCMQSGHSDRLPLSRSPLLPRALSFFLALSVAFILCFPVCLQKHATASSLHVTASDILRELEEDYEGSLLPWRSFYRRYGRARRSKGEEEEREEKEEEERGEETRERRSDEGEEASESKKTFLSSSSSAPGRACWSLQELRVLYVYLVEFVSLSSRLRELREILFFEWEGSSRAQQREPAPWHTARAGEEEKKKISWARAFSDQTLSALFDEHRAKHSTKQT